MTWLITGGAGYIGSHVVDAFRSAGYDVVVLDDLSSGHREFVPADVPFVEGSIVDEDVVRAALTDHAVTGIVHLAGFKYAGVSVQRPLHTYRQNVVGGQVLLEAVTDLGIPHFVFSSSAAVYGTPDVHTVDEDTATKPESPYGESKLVTEWMLRDLVRVSPLKATSLRYFNVVGSGRPDLYDTSPHNLFPLVIAALRRGDVPKVFGTDYATPDGSAVRDYVHVSDIALAHVAAARALEAGTDLLQAYNLGSGDGLSVLEIMAAFARVTGQDFQPEIKERRAGDPARIVASGEAARRDLDWQMRWDVDGMVRSAIEAGPQD